MLNNKLLSALGLACLLFCLSNRLISQTERSLEEKILRNFQSVNLFEGNLCLINWTNKFCIKIYKNAKFINFTKILAQSPEALAHMSVLSSNKVSNPSLLPKTVIVNKYHLHKKSCGSGAEEKNGLLAFQYLSGTPLWWNLNSLGQINQLCAYYKKLFDELNINAVKKVPLLLTVQGVETKAFLPKSLASFEADAHNVCSSESLDFLNKYFDLEISSTKAQAFVQTKQKIEFLEALLEVEGSENKLLKMFGTLDLNVCLLAIVSFLLYRTLGKASS